MSAINDEAGSEVAQGQLRSEDLQPDPGVKPPSRTTSFKDVDSELLKQHRAVSGWLSEMTLPIDELIHRFNEPFRQFPEVVSMVHDINRASSRVRSHIAPSTHRAGSPQSDITYLDLVTELEVLKSTITRLRENCDDIIAAPMYKSSLRWSLSKTQRRKAKAIKELQVRLGDATKTLELLSASMTITAAMKQKSSEETQKLNSITEALRNPQQSQHISPEEQVTLDRLAPENSGPLVLRKEQARQIHDTTLIIDQRFDNFSGSTIHESNFARHRYFRRERLKGTCDWLIRSRKFWDEWLLGNYTTSSTLFCWGDPGVGKSTIASRVIDELARIKRVHAFYYLGDCGVNSAERLVLSLLGQIQGWYSEVVPASDIHSSGFDNHYSLVGDKTVRIEEQVFIHASTRANLVMDPPEMSHQASPDAPFFSSFPAKRRATFKLLLEVLIGAISGINDTVFIVIDAWEDEKMEPGSKRNFYALLSRMRTAGCRVFLTSRTMPDSTIPFDYIPLPIKESDIRGDIDKFIQINTNDMFTEILKFPTAPRFGTSINSDPVKVLLSSFSMATLFLNYIRAVISKSKETRSRVLFALTTRASTRASILGRLVIRPADFLSRLEPERLMKGSIQRLARSSGSFQMKSTLVWLTFAVAPLPLEELSIALKRICTQLPKFESYPNSSAEGQEEEDLLSILVELDGLVVWDRGNHLIRLASDEIGVVIKSLWFSTYERNITVPLILETGILGYICLYHIQYILDVPLEDSSLQSEKAATELIQKHSFLSHAVLGWSTYCREFYNLVIVRSQSQDDVSSLPITPAEAQKHAWEGDNDDLGYPEGGEKQHNTQLKLETDCLAVETSMDQLHNPSTYLDSLQHEVSARVSQLVGDKSKLYMAMLLAGYLSPTSSHLNWEALHSWVMSMSELLIVSRLGLDHAVKSITLKSQPKHLSVGDEQGNTPLHEAARYGFEDVVRTLLSAGASVVVKNKSDMTPAEYAIYYKQNETFVPIFEQMAIMDVLDGNDALTLSYCDCIVGNRGDQRQRLNLTLFQAIRTSNIAIARYLLKHGADPNGFNDENIPILHHAIRYSGMDSGDQLSFVADSGPELLLLHGADPDIRSKDNKEESALHVAVRWGKIGAIRRLLRYGVDPRNKNSKGQHPLFAMFDSEAKSLDYNYRGIILDLVNRGADLNQPDNSDRQVLHLAAQNSLPYVIWLLIGLGAACDRPDVAGKVPLDYAEETNDQISIDLLQSCISGRIIDFEYKK